MRLFFTFWLVALSLAASLPGTAAAQEPTQRYHMASYNAQITVNTDGSLDVVEVLEYVFEEGSFKRGLREIPLDRVESIGNVRVVEMQADGASEDYTETEFNADDQRESAVPGTFGTETQDNTLRIRWIFEPLTGPATRSFRVHYRVEGAMRVYDNRYELQWKAIPPDWDTPIETGRVEVIVPGQLPEEGLQTVSMPPIAETRDGNSLVWTLDAPDDGLEIGVRIPKDSLQAKKPAWQEAADLTESGGSVGALAAATEVPVVGPLIKAGLALLELARGL